MPFSKSLMSKTLNFLFLYFFLNEREIRSWQKHIERQRQREPNLMRNAGDRSLVQFASKKFHKRQTRGTTSSSSLGEAVGVGEHGRDGALTQSLGRR